MLSQRDVDGKRKTVSVSRKKLEKCEVRSHHSGGSPWTEAAMETNHQRFQYFHRFLVFPATNRFSPMAQLHIHIYWTQMLHIHHVVGLDFVCGARSGRVQPIRIEPFHGVADGRHSRRAASFDTQTHFGQRNERTLPSTFTYTHQRVPAFLDPNLI